MAKKLTDKQKGEILGSAVSGLTGGIALGVSNAQTTDLSAKEIELQNLSGTQFDTGSYDALEEQLSNNIFAKTNYTAKDLRNRSFKELGLNTVLGTASGLISGLSKGSVLGGVIEGGAALLGGSAGMVSNYFKTQNDVADLNNAGVKTNNIVNNNIVNSASSIDNKMFNSSLLNLNAYGGPLFNHGGDWSNGLTFINEGGLHEDNPLGGVPVGMDSNFTPNLVEEGEIIWNDYVFSNRLKPTKKQLETIGFDSKYEGYTFAKIVEDVQKASAENPLDKISTDTLNENLMYLMTMQEEIRMKKEKKETNKFPDGGGLYDGVFTVYGNNGKPIYLPTAENLISKYNLDKDVPIEDVQIQDVLIEDNGIDVPEFDWSVFDNTTTNKSKLPWWQSAMRYASPALHGILLANNLQKPDYSDERALMRKASSMTRGSHTPIGTTLDLDLMDRNVYTNPILANAAANRRAIQQGPTDPRAALLANNYITNNALGMADIQGTQANNAIKAQEAQFYLTRGKENAELALRDLAMDQQADQVGLNVMANNIQSMNAKNAMRNQAVGAEASGLADDFAMMARERDDRALMEKLIASDALRWVKPTAKNGGMLTRNRRRK